MAESPHSWNEAEIGMTRFALFQLFVECDSYRGVVYGALPCCMSRESVSENLTRTTRTRADS